MWQKRSRSCRERPPVRSISREIRLWWIFGVFLFIVNVMLCRHYYHQSLLSDSSVLPQQQSRDDQHTNAEAMIRRDFVGLEGNKKHHGNNRQQTNDKITAQSIYDNNNNNETNNENSNNINNNSPDNPNHTNNNHHKHNHQPNNSDNHKHNNITENPTLATVSWDNSAEYSEMLWKWSSVAFGKNNRSSLSTSPQSFKRDHIIRVFGDRPFVAQSKWKPEVVLENYTFKCYFLHNDSAKRSVPEENPSAVVYQLSYLIERNLLEEAIATEEDLLTVPSWERQQQKSFLRLLKEKLGQDNEKEEASKGREGEVFSVLYSSQSPKENQLLRSALFLAQFNGTIHYNPASTFPYDKPGDFPSHIDSTASSRIDSGLQQADSSGHARIISIMLTSSSDDYSNDRSPARSWQQFLMKSVCEAIDFDIDCIGPLSVCGELTCADQIFDGDVVYDEEEVERILQDNDVIILLERFLCEGYVSDLLYKAISFGKIVIYAGAPDIDFYVPPSTIIDVTDYSSPSTMMRILNPTLNDLDQLAALKRMIYGEWEQKAKEWKQRVHTSAPLPQRDLCLHLARRELDPLSPSLLPPQPDRSCIQFPARDPKVVPEWLLPDVYDKRGECLMPLLNTRKGELQPNTQSHEDEDVIKISIYSQQLDPHYDGSLSTPSLDTGLLGRILHSPTTTTTSFSYAPACLRYFDGKRVECTIGQSMRLIGSADAIALQLGKANMVREHAPYQVKKLRQVVYGWRQDFTLNQGLYPEWYQGFNWFSSHRLDSDAPRLPLQRLKQQPSVTEFMGMEYSLQRRRNDTFVAWLGHNCETKIERHKYVAELMKYINIHSLGMGCLLNVPAELPGRLDPDHEFGTPLMRRVLGQYKFYLTFENNDCKAESLANYLLYLNENPDAYARYLEYKRDRTIISHSFARLFSGRYHTSCHRDAGMCNLLASHAHRVEKAKRANVSLSSFVGVGNRSIVDLPSECHFPPDWRRRYIT